MQLLLILLSACRCSSTVFSALSGESVTLPCSYDVSSNKLLPVCWNRGQIPSRGCDRPLVSTDGRSVTEDGGLSGRFRLLGRLDEGDVSLTIMNVSRADAGRYGCRVEIPGWFNDEKHHFDLTVVDPTTISSLLTLSPWLPWATEGAGQSADHVTFTEAPPTAASESVTSVQEGDVQLVVLVSVVLVSVFLVTAGGIVVIARRWSRLNKLPNVGTAIHFSTTSSTLQLQRRSSAVENIYQLDASEYESCP